MKNLATTIAILLTAAPAVAAPNWVDVGRSNSGSLLSIDQNSIDETHGDTRVFRYGVTGKDGKTKVLRADVEGCGGKPVWTAEVVAGKWTKVSIDSPAAKALVSQVCGNSLAHTFAKPQNLRCEQTRIQMADADDVKTLAFR